MKEINYRKKFMNYVLLCKKKKKTKGKYDLIFIVLYHLIHLVYFKSIYGF